MFLIVSQALPACLATQLIAELAPEAAASARDFALSTILDATPPAVLSTVENIDFVEARSCLLKESPPGVKSFFLALFSDCFTTALEDFCSLSKVC